ncbi:CHY zinc finger protein (macronuclear) [Tetrahymena thermophila SB210]|uniref:CHY zinc finger protein n=1 Tax=Tetrahymena thermophila (strain SB210) TaxID=312017 RepID=I7LU90_TETTS|nr:CHY zinc finger protein [Tetrahymena thermophila SB210]EAR90827.2 CHY zinc finger protein [Tetrahymena thermophila SB210]|eukprot:XP_001011072.2 CHY zinc finger protein [Tetrahymena thermophila SB210]
MQQIQNKRSSQDFSKSILQNIMTKEQKENKTKVRSYSPFLNKTQRSRSGSPDKNKFNTSSGALNNSKVDIGNTNIYQKPTNSKCQINKLGLSLRPFCNNKEHKRSNISHICIDDQCLGENNKSSRLVCQFCIIENHSNHKEACIPIEQFSDYNETHFKTLTQAFKEINLTSLKMNNPPFMQKIYDSLNILKLSICQNIDNQKLLIKQQIDEKAEEYVPNYQERIASYETLYTRFKEVTQKKLFELNEQEMEVLLKFLKQELVDEMTAFKKKLQGIYNIVEFQAEMAANHYQSSIQNLASCILQNNDQLFMPQKKDAMLLPGNSKLKYMKLQFFILQKKQDEIFKSLKELKLQMNDEEVVNQSAANSQNLTNQDLQNGRLLIYSEQCKHIKQAQIECNTVPLFVCCKQSYQCVKCHNNHTIHKATITSPSQRMCLKCLSVFTVEYPTNVPINCNSCLDLKLNQNLLSSLLNQDVSQDDQQKQSKKQNRSVSPQQPYTQKRSTSAQIHQNQLQPQQQQQQQQRNLSPNQQSPYQSKNRRLSIIDEKINTNSVNIHDSSTKKQIYQSFKKESKDLHLI